MPDSPSQFERIRNSRADGAALGFVTPPKGMIGTEILPLGFFDILFSPGQVYPLAVAGDYLYIVYNASESQMLVNPIGAGGLASPAYTATILVKDSNDQTVQVNKSGEGFVFPNRFSKLEFSCPVGGVVGTIRLRIYAGFGRLQDQHDGQLVVGSGSPFINTELTRAANATPYAAGQLMVANGGGAQGWQGLQRLFAAPAIITKAIVYSNSPNVANLDLSLYLFNNASNYPVGITDFQAFAPAIADLRTLIGIIRFNSWIPFAAGKYAEIDGIAVPVNSGGSTFADTIYVLPVHNGAYVPASGEIFGFTAFADRY